VTEVPLFSGWRNVPDGLYSRTQLGDLDLPRIAGGPVRAQVDALNWRDKFESVQLYRLSESTPSGASVARLESARAKSKTARVCADCGARPDLPPRDSGDADREPVARCNACMQIAKLRAAQGELPVRRADAVRWARDMLSEALLPAYVVHVVKILRPAATSGRQDRNPIAYRIDAVDAAGGRVLAATVQATRSRVKSMPAEAVPLDSAVDELRAITAAQTVVTWDALEMSPLRALVGVPAPPGWYGGNPNSMSRRVQNWRGDIDPYSCGLRSAVHPGRADRMWLLLKRMAETEV
jgi:hypothetical protein